MGGLFEGKKGLILGVANDHSIAWSIAQQVMAGGGVCGFTHLPDRADDPPLGHFVRNLRPGGRFGLLAWRASVRFGLGLI